MASIFEGLAVADYVSRTPEKLLLEGVRQWMGGYDTSCPECWERAFDCFNRELGSARAAKPLFMLAIMARTLRQSCQRTLQIYPVHCKRLCLDECCIMGMVAAAQINDEPCRELAAKILVEDDNNGLLAAAVQDLAQAFAESGLPLLQVPARVIANLSGQAWYEH
jgi:hypothetical protein